jgi:MFS family permease
MARSKTSWVFFIIILSQFCGTSLWFAGNAVLPQLQTLYQWPLESLGYITSSVQIGFILGTLLFAVSGISDKFSPSRVFFISSIIASVCSAICLLDLSSFGLVVTSRCLTGFFLAGIYPVGMKIAADWNQDGLGHWLGALVGALVLGTAFPHGLKLIPQLIEPQLLLVAVSALAVLGGLLILLFVKDGPYRKPSLRFSFADIRKVFQTPEFRAPAFGYFGHMWELYALWAFVPWAITYNSNIHSLSLSPTFLAFIVIAAGAAGCFLGGKLSFRLGSKNVAQIALVSSGICCLLSPWIWSLPPIVFLIFMIFWGFMVSADSPQFSALVAASAPAQVRGSAITITTCIGFAISIFSIQLLTFVQPLIHNDYLFLLLAPGPIVGVLLLNRSNFTK